MQDVLFHNTRTGEVRKVKAGWSWTLFFFSGLFGIPLFLRGLTTWGALFAGFWAVSVLVSVVPNGNDQTAALSLVLNFLGLGLSVFISIKGNELTAKHLLTQGWSVAHMDAPTAAALKRWNIIDPPIGAALS